MSLLSLGIGKTVVSGGLVVVGANATSANNVTTPSAASVPSGALMILSCASADDKNSALTVAITGTTLTWVKKSDVSTINGSSGQVEIWEAPCPAGGTVSPTCTWGPTTTAASSSVLYYVTGQEGTTGGAAGNADSQAAPSVALLTTRANSVIFCVCSDWSAKSPSGRVFRDTPITEQLVHDLSGTTVYVGYHWYKVTTSITTYTEGISTPSTMAFGGIAVYEVRTP